MRCSNSSFPRLREDLLIMESVQATALLEDGFYLSSFTRRVRDLPQDHVVKLPTGVLHQDGGFVLSETRDVAWGRMLLRHHQSRVF